MRNRFPLAASFGLFAVVALAACDPPRSAQTDPAQTSNIPAPDPITELSSARYMEDIMFLSRDEMQGRASGSPELELAADYIAERFREAGLTPAGDDGSYFQSFEVTTGAEAGAENMLSLGGTALSINEDFVPILFSNTSQVEAPLVFAGYGISAPELEYDDYAGIDADGKIVVVLRHEPQEMDAESKFAGTNFTSHASFINKAINARLHGALGIIFVTDPLHEDEQVGPATRRIEHGDMNIAAVHAKREPFQQLFEDAGFVLSDIQNAIDEDLMPRSFDFEGSTASLATEVIRSTSMVRNVVGALEGSDPVLKNEWVVVGAHYDHLGLGDQSSLAPSRVGEVHNGADDNASGTSGVIELARLTANDEREWARSALFMAFAAEEIGLLGSSYFADNPTVPIDAVNAMVNMDMIGRISNDRLFVGGVGTSPDFQEMLESANNEAGTNAGAPPALELDFSDSGYGASDHTPFNIKKIPVLFFFSGLHTDYHKPSDTYEKINAEGAIKVLSLVHGVVERIANAPERLAYVEVERPEAPGRGSGGGYGPYFGSVPDFRDDLDGVLFADIVNGSPAANAGLMAGDIMVEFDGLDITGLNDYAYALRQKQPGDVVDVMVKRGEEDVSVSVTLEARR
ncbi:MAG: M28 family peptidase [Micropepsaceae bacterium]